MSRAAGVGEISTGEPFALAPLPDVARRRLPFSPRHFFLVRVSAVMLLPLVWMVVLSLETEVQARRFPPVLFPGALHFQNYPNAFHAVPFGAFFLNSTMYALATVAGNLLFCALAA